VEWSWLFARRRPQPLIEGQLKLAVLNYSGRPQSVNAVVNRLLEVGYIVRACGGVFEQGDQAEDFGSLYCYPGTFGKIAPFTEMPVEEAAESLFGLLGCDCWREE
jgi:hypothetical protein